MFRHLIAVGIVFSGLSSLAVAADEPAKHPTLTAAEIASKNASARGGLQAWRGIHTLEWEGKMGAGGNRRAPVPTAAPGNKKIVSLPSDPRPAEEVQLPFTMFMERPLKTRFELQFKGQTAVQVYDGTNGWKLRPYLNRLQVEDFTNEESKLASMQSELDGPLMDYQAKGSTIELEGMEKVEDHDNYKLKITMKNGKSIHIWIDAETFLDTKVEGRPRHLDGLEHPVEVYSRDYHNVNGVQIPFVLETHVLPVVVPGSRVRPNPIPVERITIEKAVVNPQLNDSLFSKPQIQQASLSH